jgi:hypothetical protein
MLLQERKVYGNYFNDNILHMSCMWCMERIVISWMTFYFLVLLNSSYLH